MNFKVYAGEEVTKSVNLAVEDHVLIKFTVVGEHTDNLLDFYITYPNGTLKKFGKVSYFSYDFVCYLKGEYVLHFSNIVSAEIKLVSLDCEIQHYIFGIPQMLFLTIVIVVVCVGAVATFIMMSKTS
ncbi:MAG: hypothetical protein QXH37_09455 [Candidatus Bathyarchaeia archaeon]